MTIKNISRAAFVLVFTTFMSCSENDDQLNSPISTPVLIDKITSTIYYGDQSETSVFNYFYIGNLLAKVTSGADRQEFIYDDLKIIEVKVYLNNILSKTYTLTYEGDLLSTSISDAVNPERADYTYTNNNLTAISFNYVDDAQWFNYETNNYTFSAEKNISTKIRTSSQGTSMRSDYTYDMANSPMRYMNKYYRLITEFEGFDPKNYNNPITQTSFSPAESTTPVTYLYEYVYNENQFPTQIRRKTADGTVLSFIEIVYK